MAAPTTGHRAKPIIFAPSRWPKSRWTVAEDVLRPGGAFVAKVFQGGAGRAFLARMQKSFREVKHVKPPASRAESVELYLVALGFKGGDQTR